jgi:hypothetical protein
LFSSCSPRAVRRWKSVVASCVEDPNSNNIVPPAPSPSGAVTMHNIPPLPPTSCSSGCSSSSGTASSHSHSHAVAIDARMLGLQRTQLNHFLQYLAEARLLELRCCRAFLGFVACDVPVATWAILYTGIHPRHVRA